MKKIDVTDRLQPTLFGCKDYTGNQNPQGYGRVGSELAHRRAYEAVHGPIPEGLWIDHLCGNRLCCNVDHLEAVTPRENILRSPNTLASVNLAKTHCKSGHPFDKANTYRRREGGRACRQCHRIANAACHKRSARKKQSETTHGGRAKGPSKKPVVHHRRRRRSGRQLIANR